MKLRVTPLRSSYSLVCMCVSINHLLVKSENAHELIPPYTSYKFSPQYPFCLRTLVVRVRVVSFTHNHRSRVFATTFGPLARHRHAIRISIKQKAVKPNYRGLRYFEG